LVGRIDFRTVVPFVSWRAKTILKVILELN
jgi:hypothetical protein